MGENGAGKSTLMNVLSGIYPYGTYEGNIIYNGEICKFNTIKDSEEKGIVIIHQELALIPYMTIGENMYLGNERGKSFSINWNETYGEADKYLKIVGLEESSRTLIKDIGVGKQQLVEIAKALAKHAKLLILDEPTNDLDIQTLTILEDYLDSFAGIVIAVSHDRYFLDNIVDRIFAFEGNGHLTQYEGGYTDYTEALARKGGAVSEGQSTAVGAEKKKSAQADWKQNRPQKLKFTYKEQREFETIDDDIAALEELLEKLDKDMEANATNSVKLREIMEQKEKAQADLDEKMDRWVYLNDLAERIEAQKSEK